MPALNDRSAVSCWECEAMTDRPADVVLRTPAGRVGHLCLRRACYRAYFLPLGPDTFGTLLIEPDAEDAQAS